ncbi:hypothetical protein L9F63_026353, partial [Diploptera punctata]
MWKTLFAIAACAPALAKLPNYIDPCVRNSPEFEECLLNRTMMVMPHIGEGVPELNVPRVEPLIVHMLHLEQGSSGVKLKMSLRDLNIRGLSMYLFRKFKLDLSSMPHATALIWLPRIMLDADYEVDGKLLLVPLKGKGHMYANASSLTVDLSVGLQRRQVDGKTYLHPLSTNIKLKFGGDSDPHLGNIFDTTERS